MRVAEPAAVRTLPGSSRIARLSMTLIYRHRSKAIHAADPEFRLIRLIATGICEHFSNHAFDIYEFVMYKYPNQHDLQTIIIYRLHGQTSIQGDDDDATGYNS